MANNNNYYSNITMQNTVVQHNALNLSSSAYMNSTTKFVKGITGSTSTLTDNKIQAIIAPLASSLSPSKGHRNGQAGIIGSLVVAAQAQKNAEGKGQARMSKKEEEEERRHEEEVELMAMNLSASIFMNSTTKFVKGFALLVPNNSNTAQKKGSAKKRSKSMIRESRSESPSTFIKQRTPEKIGLDMTATNYMNSTTKYLKPSDDAPVDAAKGKIEKIVRGQRTSSTQKLEHTLNRNRLKSENEGNKERSISKSDSGNKISRRKDRSKDLKFIESRINEESSVTVKEKVPPKEGNYRRNDAANVEKVPQTKTEIIPNRLSNQRKAQEVNDQRSANTLPDPKISRNKIGQAKSADAKKVEQREQAPRPFVRQPQNARPTLISSKAQQEATEKNNQNATSILQTQGQKNKTPIKKDAPKTATTLPSGELPITTPLKSQQSVKVEPAEHPMNRNQAKPKISPPISTIKEEKASIIHNAKPINNKKVHYHGSILEEQSVHVNNSLIPVVCTANRPSQISKYTKNESVKLAGKDETSQITEKNYTISKVNSAQNLKTEEKSEETVVIPSKRAIVRKQEKAEPVKERKLQIKPVSSPTIVEEKKSPRAQIPLKKNVQSEHQEEISSKTSLEQPIVPQNRYGMNKKIESNKISREENAIVNRIESVKVIPTEHIETAKPKKPISVTQIPPPPVKLPSSPKAQQPITKAILPNEANLALAIKDSIKQEAAKPQQKALIQQQQRAVQTLPPPTKYQSLLKQSQILAQIVTKYYLNSLSKSFSSLKLKANESKSHRKEATILTFEAISIHQTLYLANLRSAIQQLKKIAVGNYSNKKAVSFTNSKETAANIIFRTLLSKEREYFQQLKWAKSIISPLPTAKPEAKGQQIEGSNKAYIISQFVKIVQFYNTNQSKNAFSKLLLEATSQKKKNTPKPITQSRSPSKPIKAPRDYQQQKKTLTQAKTQLQSQISYIQTRIFDKKRYSDMQKSKLIKKQDEYNKKIRAVDSQVVEKRKKNKELRSQIQQISQLQDLDISLPEYQPLVGILTQIYSGIFGSSEETINVRSLREKYSLLKEDSNPLLKEWEAIALNARLKGQVRLWQGESGSSERQQSTLSQRQILGNVVRSYVRQRYLWQWVKTTAEKM